MILKKYKNNRTVAKTVLIYKYKHDKKGIKWLKSTLELSGNSNKYPETLNFKGFLGFFMCIGRTLTANYHKINRD